jgi:hypothetical protein
VYEDESQQTLVIKYPYLRCKASWPETPQTRNPSNRIVNQVVGCRNSNTAKASSRRRKPSNRIISQLLNESGVSEERFAARFRLAIHMVRIKEENLDATS